jgi:hypothetical protein
MRSEYKRSVASLIRMSTLRTPRGDDLVLALQLLGAQPSLLMVAAVEARNLDKPRESNLSAEDLVLVQSPDARATRLAPDGLVGLGVLRKDEGCCRSTPTSPHHLHINAENAPSIEGRASAISMEPR